MICLVCGCETGSPVAFVLPSLDGTWNIQLKDVPGTLRIVVEASRITEYDQGDGEFQPIEESPPFVQNAGRLSFTFQATQAFVGFNNDEPAEFLIEGEGRIRENGSVDITITFTAVDGGEQGATTAVMSR